MHSAWFLEIAQRQLVFQVVYHQAYPNLKHLSLGSIPYGYLISKGSNFRGFRGYSYPQNLQKI